MGFSDLVSPVASSYWNNGQLGEDDGPTNSGGDFLAALDAQADVTLAVSDGNERLEASTLTGAGLLLYGHDLQDLIFQLRGPDEEIDDFGLFDWKRVQIDLFKLEDLSVLDQTSKLGDGHPLLLILLAASPAATTPSAAPPKTTPSSVAATRAESSAEPAATTGRSCVRHSANKHIFLEKHSFNFT